MSFEFLTSLVLAHGYLVVFLAVALDCAALPIPGELLLLTIGGLAVKGHLDPAWALTVAAAGGVIAGFLRYWMGRVGGHPGLPRVGRPRAARAAPARFWRVGLGPAAGGPPVA